MFEWIYQFRNAVDCVRFQRAKSSTRRKKLIIFNNVGVTLSVVFCFHIDISVNIPALWWVCLSQEFQCSVCVATSVTYSVQENGSAA